MASNVEQGRLACGGQAAAVRLAVVGTTYVADFTGHITMLFDPNVLSRYLSGAAGLVELLIDENVFNGIGAMIGPITWVRDPDRDPGPSSLRPVTPGMPFPGIQDFVLNINMTIPNLLPGITLRNVIPSNPGPPILRNANVTNFPPQNDVYQLVEPIDLEDVNNPGPVLATIQNFPVTVNPPTA
jgi:hypothetical protein